jgi:hypothetical protein
MLQLETRLYMSVGRPISSMCTRIPRYELNGIPTPFRRRAWQRSIHHRISATCICCTTDTIGTENVILTYWMSNHWRRVGPESRFGRTSSMSWKRREPQVSNCFKSYEGRIASEFWVDGMLTESIGANSAKTSSYSKIPILPMRKKSIESASISTVRFYSCIERCTILPHLIMALRVSPLRYTVIGLTSSHTVLLISRPG